MATEPKTLREAYDAYKEGKRGMGRQDMFGWIVDAVEALQARIGAVDEAAVAALDKRLMGLEVGIGNALTAAMHGKYLPASGDIPIIGMRGEPAPYAGRTTFDPKEVRYVKRRGRPPSKKREPPAPMNEMGV